MGASVPRLTPDSLHLAQADRIRELEARLQESEETLEAIRRGDFDAVVVQNSAGERQVYTLENADRPYRALIEQIQEGALTLSADGVILYCNHRLAAMLDEPQERLIGQSLARFVRLDDREALAGLLAGARDAAVRGEIELCLDGTRGLPVNLSLSELQRDEATPLLCGVLTDLSEQKQHLREVSDANARLEAESQERERVEEVLRQSQKMEAIGQLTGGVAHDFNNLLTIIRSSTELLQRPNLAEDRRKRYVDAISDTVDRASKLTGQLLAFARRQALKPEIFDVGAQLRVVTDMLATIVGSRIQIERDVPREPCFIEADVSQFEVALVNLAVNARDAMNGEGLLGLCVRTATAPALPDAPQAKAGFVAVTMSDTGVGIASDKLARIFEPFFTTKAVGKGTGLGLSQVFGFAKQSGGQVTVASEVGRGTQFTLYLPRAEPAAAAAAVALDLPEGGDGEGRRVLVVEDNVDVGTFSTQLLQDLGYETTWAAGAEEALAILVERSREFDAVFSDVVMPGMNGLDLGREIRRRYPSLPVILTSGYSDVLADDTRHGFELLQKPYAIESVSQILRRVTGRVPADHRASRLDEG